MVIMKQSLDLIMYATIVVLGMPILVYGQITTLCTGALLQSFAPCTDFASKLGGNSPTQDCCTSLKYLMGNGTGCLCLIATGGVPFKSPVNPDLAMSLPKACNMSGVPIQCKGPDESDSPLTPGGTLSPPADGGFVPGLTPGGGLVPPPDFDLTPPLTPPGTRPTLSDATPLHIFSPTLLLVASATTLLKYL